MTGSASRLTYGGYDLRSFRRPKPAPVKSRPSMPNKGSGLPVLLNFFGNGAGAGSAAGAGAGAAAASAGAGAGAATWWAGAVRWVVCGAGVVATTGLGLGAVPVNTVLAAISVMGASTIFDPLTIMPFLRSNTSVGLPSTVNL